MEITFLGSGTSSGVPIIGCSCEICLSTDPKDKRLRSSIFIDLGESHQDGIRYILVDCGPDFREQALRFKLPRLDAVLFTHAHADHIFGLDDIRIYNFKQKDSIPLYADKPTADALHRIFSYCFFRDPNYEGGGVPSLTLNEINSNTAFTLGNIEIVPIKIFHGRTQILGFRIGDFAYLTDCSSVPDESIPLLKNLEMLVVSGLRHKHHATHFTVKGAVDLINELKPQKALLTHISHDLSHQITEDSLANNSLTIKLAYDGLKIKST